MPEGWGLQDLLTTADSEPEGAHDTNGKDGTVSPVVVRDPEWIRFEADIRRARKQLMREAIAVMTAGKQPAKITVSSVANAASRSRSQFYASHVHLKSLVIAAQSTVEWLAARRAKQIRIAERKPTVPSLERMVKLLEAELKRCRAENISKVASELYELHFSRDRELARAETARYQIDLAKKDMEIAQLRAQNEKLHSIITFKTAP